MKPITFLTKSILTAVLLMFALYAFANGGTLGDIDWSTPAGIFDGMDAIYAVLVLVGGYLSSKIPFFRSINDMTYRVAALALVLLIVFVMFGWSEWKELLLSYASITSLYELFFGKIMKSPKSAEPT